MKEALSQLYAYTGFPRSLNALGTLKKVMEQRGDVELGVESSPLPDSYDALKQVYPEAIAIVHLDGACDPYRYNFIFDGLSQYGAKWDMIGLSVYPYWDIDAGLTKNEDETLEKAIANINALYEKYHTPLMIVETGYDADRPEAGKLWMKRLIDATRHHTGGHCEGIFYWAPEAEGHYKLGAFRNHRPTVIMDAFKEFVP